MSLQAGLAHLNQNPIFGKGETWSCLSTAPSRPAPPAAGSGSDTVSLRPYAPSSRAKRQDPASASGEKSVPAGFQQADGRELLSAEQEQNLARRMAHPRNRADYESARQTLISANQRLVVFTARRYQREGFPLEDLVQEGTVGLIQAVDRFDYRQGVRLSTYALWWIRQAILRALEEQGALIRLPGHVQTRLRQLQKTQQSLRARLGRSPSREEWARAAGLTEEQMNRLLAGAMSTVSLEAPAGPTQETALADLIPAAEECDPAAQAAQHDAGRTLRQALGTLSRQEQEILTMHYGLEDNEPKSLDQISRAWRVSHERIRQMEMRALVKLRRRLSAAL
jgi:RNA polymerase sigma factor (sigma-70 family)